MSAKAADVARLAGVSVSTVSLVLNGNGRISAKTIEQVRAAAAQLNYVPNAQASGLRRRITHRIALVVPDIGNSVYVSIAKSIQQVAKAKGYYVSLVSTDGIEGADIDALQLLHGGQVDGMVLISLKSSRALEQGLKHLQKPICVIGRVPGNLGVDNVQANSDQGVRLAVEHLLGLGRRRLVFINGPLDTNPAVQRLEGYRQSIRAAGLEERLVTAEFTLEGGYAAAEEALNSYPNADALVCANDLLGIGALKWLRQRKIRVPEDIAVSGMDDIRECEICSPALTSVALHAAERGRMAAQMLFDRLSGASTGSPIRVVLEPTLRVRESTGGQP
ncbi:MAG: LacI family DNA-binding transcriptional regulator [Meiothermus sp.]|nr:LacI family DNA-binding transcriptional regulator [Meiothermus sp.]